MYEKMMVILYKDNRTAIDTLQESTQKAIRTIARHNKCVGLGMTLIGVNLILYANIIGDYNKRIVGLENRVKELGEAMEIKEMREDLKDE